MPRGPTRPTAAAPPRAPAVALAAALALGGPAAGCGREFASEPAAAPRVEARPGWRDTLSVTDTAEVEFGLTDPRLGPLAPGRATWTSSDDRVLRVEPLPAATGDAARDTLAARRTRVRVVAAGPGAVTLTVRTDATGAVASAARDFPVVVRPLRYVPVRWRAALSAGESDTLQVEVRDVRGRVLTDRTLRWQSSDETRLRLVPIPASGAAGDAAAERRLKVRAVALADGRVDVTVGLDPSVAAVGSDTTIRVDVAALGLVRSRGLDTLAVADTDTLQVRLSTSVTDSIAGRFLWESSNDAVLRLSTPPGDSLAARGARRVVTALAPGTATLTATSIPAAGEPAVQRRWTVTVLGLNLEQVVWRATMSVADTPRYAVRVVDTRGRPALGATVIWRSSADTVLALAAGASGARGEWGTTGSALRHGAAVVTAVALGPTGAPAGALAVPVNVLERYVQVVVLNGRSCALSVRGLAYCWGARIGGAVDLVPTPVVSGFTQQPVRFVRLAAGVDHLCGESAVADGSWSCWGRNDAGQLTDASPGADQTNPVPMLLGGARPGALWLAREVSCMSAGRPGAIRQSDSLLVYCWGQGGGPVLAGRGSSMPRLPNLMEAVPHSGLADDEACDPGPSNFRLPPRCLGFYDVATTRDRGCALRRSRMGGNDPLYREGYINGRSYDQVEELYCWGAGVGGVAVPVYRVGTNETAPRVLTDLVIASGGTPCFLQAGTPTCWDGAGTPVRPVPTLADLVPGTVTLSPGWSIACGIRRSGQAVCDGIVMGAALARGVGIGSGDIGPGPSDRVTTLVVAPDDGDGYHGCAVQAGDGGVYCWGNNTQGQLGTGRRAVFTGPSYAEGYRRVVEPAR